MDDTSRELLALTRRLLEAIAGGDFTTYAELCDESLTAFEPEGLGQLVEGLDFHRFYFNLGGHQPGQNTLAAPRVRLLGQDAALVTYTRLVQSVGDDGNPRTAAFEETRVWQRIGGAWKHVHFHRSRPGG
jgi:calcium/calmodulin-dependent protein kinase (CaM kinase) II